jgi:hypothetical protein
MTPTDTCYAAWAQSARRMATWTTGLLVLFVVLVAATIAFCWMEAQKALSPERVADQMEGYIASHVDEWRKEVRRELARKAPAAAQRMVKQAEASLPHTREQVEEYLDRKVKAGLTRASAVAEQDFRKFLADNRDYVRQGFAQLQQVPARAPQLAAGLEEGLDRQLGVNLRQEAGALLEALGQLDARLEKLGRDKGLTPSEQVERRIVRTLRALQREAAKEVRDR